MVLFTDSIDEELDEIARLSAGAARCFYIYSPEAESDIGYFRMALPGFIFVPLKETRSPKYAVLFAGNSPDDFFVLKQPRLSNIMDRDIEMHQIILRGRKLVVDNHPFLGKSDVYWCYFLYSFFDKSLLGYPHSYAFRDARTVGNFDPFDPRMLARKVASATRSTKPTVFDEPITVHRVCLSPKEKADYAVLKELAFESEASPHRIIRRLKMFVDDLPVMQDSGGERLNLLSLGRVWGQYQRGVRRIVVSDSAVDKYLLSEWEQYHFRANTFLETIYQETRNGS
jgi:hypothetical protein